MAKLSIDSNADGFNRLGGSINARNDCCNGSVDVGRDAVDSFYGDGGNVLDDFIDYGENVGNGDINGSGDAADLLVQVQNEVVLVQVLD